MSAVLSWLTWTLGTAALGALFFYGLVPLLLRRKIVINARPLITPIKVGEMPPEAYAYFGETSAALQACGFSVRTYLHVAEQTPDTQAFLALWVNESAGQQALAAIIYHHPPGRQVTARRFVEFMTKSGEGDGVAVLTNNSGELDPFPSLAGRHVLPRVPTLDLQQLYRVHLFREAQHLRPDVTRHLPDAGDEVQTLADGVEYDLRQRAKAGFLYEDDAAPNVFRPTLWGTYKLVWAEMPPFKDARHTKAHAVAFKALREALVHPLRALENAPVTHKSPYRLPPRRLPKIAA